MKILLVIFGLFFSSGLFADNQRCVIEDKLLIGPIENQIKNNCKKGDVLVLQNIRPTDLHLQIGWWCNFDKTITYNKVGDFYYLNCILQSTEVRPRRQI